MRSSSEQLSVIIITLSYRVATGERQDLGGDAVAEAVSAAGMNPVRRLVIADDYDQLVAHLKTLADEHAADIILTTGGTGLSATDITPEATLAVIDRRLHGLELMMMQAGLEKTPHAALSRAVAGTRRDVLIINLPGNPRGAVENLSAILDVLPHAVHVLQAEQVRDEDHKHPRNP